MNKENSLLDQLVRPVAVRLSVGKIKFVYLAANLPEQGERVILLQAPDWQSFQGSFWSDPSVIEPAIAKYGYLSLEGSKEFHFKDRKKMIEELEKQFRKRS